MPPKPETFRSWLLRRNRMTIGAGFIGSEGILLCSDTKVASPGSSKSDASKILKATFGTENPRTAASLLVAVSGPLKYARMAALECFAMISKIPPQNRSIQVIFDSFKEGLNECHKKYIYPHPHYKQDRLLIQMLIGIQHKGELALFSSEETAIEPVASYDAIGRGYALADFILIPMLEDIPHMGMKELALWATHMLMAVKANDDNCGGWSELKSLGKDGSISGTSYFEISVSEKYIERYERATRKLFTAAMSPSSGAIEFENAQTRFRTEMLKIREHLQERKPEYDEMFRILTKRIYQPSTVKTRPA